jgi:3',5'-cyclic AMP phosphodiesterase CpdA
MHCVSLPQSETVSNGVLHIAHLSDLHLTNDVTVEADLPRSQVQEVCSSSLQWSMGRVDALFLTGDITDQGRPGEWDQFLDVISSLGLSLDSGRILLVPGNHDLSLVTSHEPGSSLSELAYDRHAYTFITKILMRCPQEWMMMTETGRISVRSHLESVKDYLDCYGEYPPFKRSTPAGGGAVVDIWFPKELLKSASLYKGRLWPSYGYLMCHDFLRMAYPMVMLDDDNYLIIGLNSCEESPGTLLNSGFGRLGRKQIRRFEALVKDAGARCVVVLLHHHVGFPPQILTAMKAKHRRVEIRALALRDAYKFARILTNLDKCVIFHGHKHIGYRAKLGNATVISGPSVTYGDEFGGSNCGTYAIGNDGSVKVIEDSSFRGVIRKTVNNH